MLLVTESVLDRALVLMTRIVSHVDLINVRKSVCILSLREDVSTTVKIQICMLIRLQEHVENVQNVREVVSVLQMIHSALEKLLLLSPPLLPLSNQKLLATLGSGLSE